MKSKKKNQNSESNINQDQSHSLDDVRCDDEDDEDDDDSYFDEEQAPPAAKVIASTGNTVSGQSTITHSASGGTLSMRQGTAKSVHIFTNKKNTSNFQTIRCSHCIPLFVLFVITLDLFMFVFIRIFCGLCPEFSIYICTMFLIVYIVLVVYMFF